MIPSLVNGVTSFTTRQPLPQFPLSSITMLTTSAEKLCHVSKRTSALCFCRLSSEMLTTSPSSSSSSYSSSSSSSKIITRIAATGGGVAGRVAAAAASGVGTGLKVADVTRTSMRLESVYSYAIISALLLQATLRLYTITPKETVGDDIPKREKLVRGIFAILSCLTILTGAYTTVVFSLLSLYCKTALGMNNDAAFLEFFEVTTPYRTYALNSFIATLLFFESCFVASMYLNHDGRIRWWVFGIASILATVSWFQWESLILIAGKLLLTDI